MQEREKSDCRENRVFFFVLICNSYDVDLKLLNDQNQPGSRSYKNKFFTK